MCIYTWGSYIYICMCVYIYMNLMCIYTYIYIFICIHTYVYLYAYICTSCMCTYMHPFVLCYSSPWHELFTLSKQAMSAVRLVMSQIGRDFKQLRRGMFISDRCNTLQAFEQMIFVRAGNLDGWTTASVQLSFGLSLLPSSFKLSLSHFCLSLLHLFLAFCSTRPSSQ